MGEVRRADGDEVDAFVLGTRRLGSDHVLPGVVDTRGVETEEASLLPPAFGVHVKCTRDELDAAVDPHRHPVDISDEGADAAPDHRHSQLSHTHISPLYLLDPLNLLNPLYPHFS